MVHYGKLEEFVCLVMETFPELLSESQRTELTLGLQVRGEERDGEEGMERRLMQEACRWTENVPL